MQDNCGGGLQGVVIFFKLAAIGCTLMYRVSKNAAKDDWVKLSTNSFKVYQ